jgi:hypothetical protein
MLCVRRGVLRTIPSFSLAVNRAGLAFNTDKRCLFWLNFVLGVKTTHNAKKSVLYVNQHPADTVPKRRRGSIKLDFHTKVLGVKRLLDGTGHFEPVCLIMEAALLVFTASDPFCPRLMDKTMGELGQKWHGMGENRQM